MNINYKENGGKKSFPTNSKHHYSVSQCGEHDWSANAKRNGDCYEYPSLSHFIDKLWLQGKWWKEKLFMQIQGINIVSQRGEHDSSNHNKKNED